MKIELLNGYFIENKGSNFTLKLLYEGIRKGIPAECEKIISYHQSFESAAERFLNLYRASADEETLVTLEEYVNSVKQANTEAVRIIQDKNAERFYMYVPKGNKEHKEHSIIDLIPIGRENAISRDALTKICVKHGLIRREVKDKDRVMRCLVEKARMDYIIIKLSTVGYYRLTNTKKATAEEMQDLQKYIRQGDSRAKANFRNLSMAKKLYEDYKTERF